MNKSKKRKESIIREPVKLIIDPVTLEPSFWQRISKEYYIEIIQQTFKTVNKQLETVMHKFGKV